MTQRSAGRDQLTHPLDHVLELTLLAKVEEERLVQLGLRVRLLGGKRGDLTVNAARDALRLTKHSLCRGELRVGLAVDGVRLCVGLREDAARLLLGAARQRIRLARRPKGVDLAQIRYRNLRRN